MLRAEKSDRKAGEVRMNGRHLALPMHGAHNLAECNWRRLRWRPNSALPDDSHCAKGWPAFGGVKSALYPNRRGGTALRIIDDYAHHPVEIKAATLNSAASGRRALAVAG